MRHDVSQYARVEGKARESFHIYSKWGMRQPLLTLSEKDRKWGRTQLQELGLAEDKWFVCIHSREGGYSPIDEKIHTHRNGDIENLIPAIQHIISEGGCVIRLGDPSMKPLPKMTNVIDYAHHPLKSPRLDVILCASCKFILGSTSGICLVSNLFGIPAAIANMVPVADLWYGPRDISIPKRLWSELHRRHLSLQESIRFPYGCLAYPNQYTKAQLKLVDNTPDDILELAIEMMARLSTNEFVLPEDTLTSAFYKELWDERFASFNSCSHLGVYFYRKYLK
jgi:putative glycosyltransferase (TIGR04372 family)